MIRGIGIDAVEVERIENTMRNWEERFLDKVFTPRERDYCLSKFKPAQHFAVRFAAKEALSKAVATGWAGSFRWKDVEVVNAPSGRPEIRLSGGLARVLAGCAIHLSLTHSESSAVAVVIVEA